MKDSNAKDNTVCQDSIAHNRYFWNNRYQKEGQIWGETPSMCAIAVKNRLQSGNIIDIGCGYGRDSIYLAEAGFQVTGVDISETAIDLCRELAREKGDESQFCLKEDMIFETHRDYFDAAISNRALHLMIHAEERRKFIDEIYHVLKSGGLLSLAARSVKDPTRPDSHKDIEEPAEVRPGHWVKFFTPEEFRVSFEKQFKIISLNEVKEQESGNPGKYTVILHIIGEKI